MPLACDPWLDDTPVGFTESRQGVVIHQEERIENDECDDPAVFSKVLECFKEIRQAEEMDVDVEIQHHAHIEENELDEQARQPCRDAVEIQPQDRVAAEEHDKDERCLLVIGDKKRQQPDSDVGYPSPLDPDLFDDNEEQNA